MPTAPRTVTGNVATLTGDARAGIEVTFVRTGAGDVFGQYGDVVVNEPIKVTSGVGGALSVVLYPGTYSVLCNGANGPKRGTMALTEDGSTDLTDLIGQAAPLLSSAAELARDKAREWATNPEDDPVEPGEFSALHHAAKSAASAGEAADSAAAAAVSETNAAASEAAAELAASDTAASVVSYGAIRDQIEADRAEIAVNKDLAYGYQQSAAAAVAYQNLSAVALSKALTALDVFVYDTSKDSDGGAWRKRCQHTSWFDETLNTANRGARREFPAVAVIVAETNRLVIYDGDDPTMPVWMIFNVSTNGLLSVSAAGRSLHMLNGELALGSTHTAEGLVLIDFVGDRAWRYRTPATAGPGGSVSFFHAGLAQRNASVSGGAYALGDTNQIVNAVVNDVAMTVLPDAPVDPATGLPVPTIAVATAGGLSVVTHSGVVFDATPNAHAWWSVAFREPDKAVVGTRFANGRAYNLSVVYMPITADRTTNDENYGRLADASAKDASLFGDAPSNVDTVRVANDGLSLRTSTHGIFRTLPKPSAKAALARAQITTAFNSGWMVGDVKGAFLSSKDTASLIAPATDADRSVYANPITGNGTLTRSPVAAGAELVGYSGFSAANYLEQAFSANLNFGTGGFCVMGWINEAANSAIECIVERDSATTAQRWTLDITAAGLLRWTVDDNTTTRTATTTQAIDNGQWTHFAALYDGAGGLQVYLNGQSAATASGAALLTLNNASAVLRAGIDVAGAAPLTSGSLALLRIGATAPTAEQIRRIYEDERPLFRPGAACTLFGASDAVTALAHDPDTGLLHVGTSAGRSVFQGLRRVANTATAVGAAISAVNGFVVEE